MFVYDNKTYVFVLGQYMYVLLNKVYMYSI